MRVCACVSPAVCSILTTLSLSLSLFLSLSRPGHDGSLRFWNFDSKACIQEVRAHRKHYDEAIFNVACHSSKPFFASAGADGIAKVLE